jgi:hypothetical protein
MTTIDLARSHALTVWLDEIAPRAFQWCACVGDYDLDCAVGSGATEIEAIQDLLGMERASRPTTKRG